MTSRRTWAIRRTPTPPGVACLECQPRTPCWSESRGESRRVGHRPVRLDEHEEHVRAADLIERGLDDGARRDRGRSRAGFEHQRHLVRIRMNHWRWSEAVL